MSETKRFFFGMEVDSPWPDHFPAGRIIPASRRHMTLAFLGEISFPLDQMPLPPFSLGFVGLFDHLLLLPPQRPKVISWHVHWLDSYSDSLLSYQKSLSPFFLERNIAIDKRPFLPHVTLARAPFDSQKWQAEFSPLPALFTTLHLYESRGNLEYVPIWSYPLIPPFEEKEHTADIAYLIHGITLEQLLLNAQIALAFRFPPLLTYLAQDKAMQTIEDVVMQLNALITQVDGEIGCPFKAVSFHGELVKKEKHFRWEMIVDV